MSGNRHIQVLLEDRTPHKWIVPLTEECFNGFLTKGNNVICKVFGEGSFFSPMLFGKFFDPSDAFPLWDFEADVLLANLRGNGHSGVDWVQTDREFVLKSELTGVGEDLIQVCVEKGKILEISGQYRKNQNPDPKTSNWKSSHWWEHGFVRRIELPENADWKKTEVTVKNDLVLEIKIPMKSSTSSPSHSGDASESTN